MIPWLERALEFEPSREMQARLKKAGETFAQYVVRVMSYSCPRCGAPAMTPCDEKAALGSCGVQFHRARCVAAKCRVTTTFLEDLERYR